MHLRLPYILLLICFLSGASSCRTWRGPKEYIERDGLHSGKKPHELAAEFKPKIKKEKRAYKKQLRRAAKDIKKRQRKKAKGNYYDQK